MCSPPENCDNVFTLCETTFSLQQDLFASVDARGDTRQVGTVDNPIYEFSGESITDNWLFISDDVKRIFLEKTDDFSVSLWLRIHLQSNSAYILSFEVGVDRYFSLYERSRTRLNFIYYRDAVDGSNSNNDLGYNTQVAFSFYYDTAIFPRGVRDGIWHFIALTIDYPIITLTIDGYIYRPTQGNYYNFNNDKVDLNRDGTIYNMPAPILTKSESQINIITAYIGGSNRGTQYALMGAMRQFMLTDILDTETYNCLGSCNTALFSVGTVNGDFTTFYNPARRSFEFSSNSGPDNYTSYLRSLVYSDNGFLMPETQDETILRRIFIQVNILSIKATYVQFA